MKANIKLSVGDTTYNPGDTIDKKISETDKAFLLREGYISDEEKPKPNKKCADARKPETPEVGDKK